MATNNSINNSCPSGLSVTGGAFTVTSGNNAVTINSGTGNMFISNDTANTACTFGSGIGAKTVSIGNTIAGTTVDLNTPSGTMVSATNGLSAAVLKLPTTTSTLGQLQINSTKVLHAYGTNNVFVGNAGNFTLSGESNTVVGQASAGAGLTSGSFNSVLGSACLSALTTGTGNVSVGFVSLASITSGSNNVGIGYQAGVSAVTGSESSNVWINSPGINGDSNSLRIGSGTGTGAAQFNKSYISGIQGINVSGAAVIVSTADQLGVVVSSLRYKDDVEDMGDASSPLLKLRPVTFTYNTDETKAIQTGLIAEEVYELLPNLVILDKEGLPQTLKYQDLSVLLLNELQKLAKRVEQLEAQLKG